MKSLNRVFLIIDLLLLILLGIVLYAWRIEPRWVEWNQVDMPIQQLPNDLIGKKIVQISDIHIGDQVEEEFIIREFQKINSIKPDIVIYTGDFISPVRIDQAPYEQLEKILQHKAVGKIATLAILGNHDYSILARSGLVADSVTHILQKNGIQVLRNEAINLQGLNIIGIDDYWGTNFYPRKALAHIIPHKANIVLVHNPDVVDLDIWGDYEGWILSGHTHGGQVRIPFGKPVRTPVDNKNYDSGLKQLPDGRTLYVNKGIGHSIRIRFNVRPEVTFFTLQKKSTS